MTTTNTPFRATHIVVPGMYGFSVKDLATGRDVAFFWLERDAVDLRNSLNTPPAYGDDADSYYAQIERDHHATLDIIEEEANQDPTAA